jgi:hypothetical protein
MRFGKGGHVGGIAHFAHVHADERARERGLAVVCVRNQGELDFDGGVAHRSSGKARPAPSRSGACRARSRLTTVAAVPWKQQNWRHRRCVRPGAPPGRPARAALDQADSSSSTATPALNVAAEVIEEGAMVFLLRRRSQVEQHR